MSCYCTSKHHNSSQFFFSLLISGFSLSLEMPNKIQQQSLHQMFGRITISASKQNINIWALHTLLYKNLYILAHEVSDSNNIKRHSRKEVT